MWYLLTAELTEDANNFLPSEKFLFFFFKEKNRHLKFDLLFVFLLFVVFFFPYKPEQCRCLVTYRS